MQGISPEPLMASLFNAVVLQDTSALTRRNSQGLLSIQSP